MIRYQLICQCKYQFDSWFRSSDDFDNQKDQELLSCPACGSSEIEKALMAPNVTTSRKKEKVVNQLTLSKQQNELVDNFKKLREHVTQNAEYVGEQFSDEARKIHYGDSEKRGIYGEANLHEIGELHDEGIDVLPLPELPEEKN